MKRAIYLAIALVSIFFVACSNKEDLINPEITFQSDSEILIANTIPTERIITFNSSQEWKAASQNESWYSFSPKQGNAGVNSITITAIESNNTEDLRTGVITIISQGVSKQITVKQETNNLILAPQSEYIVSSNGGIINVAFTTKIPIDRISLQNSSSWITFESINKGLEKSSAKINISANPGKDERSGTLTLKDTTTGGISSTIQVTQEGERRISTDYSADGQVHLLQKASIGTGVPVVIMGDAFTDTDIANGTYMEVMKKTMENFFTEEPMASLRSYFNIYTVTAVSRNSVYGSKYKTAFSCTLEGGGINTHIR